eukprot:scaffold3930_cov116-Isochrysis_galbana.AAC.6
MEQGKQTVNTKHGGSVATPADDQGKQAVTTKHGRQRSEARLVPTPDDHWHHHLLSPRTRRQDLVAIIIHAQRAAWVQLEAAAEERWSRREAAGRAATTCGSSFT